jgi:hypothetical protein
LHYARHIPGAAPFIHSGRERTLQNPGNAGTASLGKVARGGSAAFPTVVDAPTQLNPVSASVIERLTGVKLPTGPMKDFEGYHSRS